MHMDIRLAVLPQQLIRARFAAMAMGNMDFFRQSIVRKHRHLLKTDEVRETFARQVFHSITLTHVERKGFLRHRAVVHSRIVMGRLSKPVTHAERTYLKRELGAWRIIHIDHMETGIPEPKNGRNVPCPCGSGQKYKRCCGATHPVAQS